MAVKFLNGIDVDGSMNIAASDVPNLDASKITSGTFSADRIPNLSGVYQPAGDYLDLETANTTFQPIGNYLTSVPSEYLTQTEGDARYLRLTGGTLSNNLVFSNDSTGIEFYSSNSLKKVYGTGMVLEVDATRTNDLVLQIKRGTDYYHMWHSGHFTSSTVSNWNTAYGWGNHASAGYLTSVPAEYLTQTEGDARYLQSLPSHNHDTLYDAIGSADAVGQQVNERIDTEVFDAITSAQATADAALPKSGGTLYKATNTAGTSGTTFLTVHNNVGGDISQQQSFVDFMFTDTNANFTPQVRIGAQVGRNADANAISKEGAGAFVVYTGDGTDESGNGALSEAMRIGFDNKLYVQGEIQASGYNKTNWDTAYGWGNHASAGYLTSIPSTYATDAEVSTAVGAVDARINEEVIPAINDLGNAIPTNNNQLTNGAGYITSADGGNAATLEGRRANDFLKANDGELSNTDLNTLYDDDSTLYFSNTNYSTNSNIPYQNYFTLLNLRNPYGDNTGDPANSLDRGSQLWFGDTPGRFYVRYFQGTSTGWHPWEQVWTSHSLTSVSQLTNDSSYATESYVNTAVANLVDSAPGALNTLNELAAALGDDANFSTTVANNIGAIDTRINDEVIPYIDAVAGDAAKGVTAYGWGNHASAGYLTTETYTGTITGVSTGTGLDGTASSGAVTITLDLSELTDMTAAVDTAVDELILLDNGAERRKRFAEIFGSAAYSNTSAFDSAGSAAAVSTALNERIDTEVFDAIGAVAGDAAKGVTAYGWGNHASAGYLTSVPSSFTTTNITATGYIKGGGQQLVLSAGEAQNYATGQTAEYIYMNAEQGLEINSDTGNWAGGWAARKTAYLRGDQLTLDGETLTKTNIQNFKTAYGWGDHASAGYLTSIPSTYATDAEVTTAVGVVNTRIDEEVIPAITAVGSDASKGVTAYGWGDHSAAGYLTSLPAHNHDTLYDSLGSANAVALQVNDRIDTEVFDAIATVNGNIPTNNNQLTNGAGYITAVPSSFSTNSITIGSGVTLSESTDRADLLMIKSSTSTWGGLQVSNTSNEIIFSLMGDGTTGGIYDDQNSDWLIQWTENAAVRLYYNAGEKLTTTSTGVSITGALVASGDVTAFSDARVKENVETLSNALESVKTMRGVTYNKIGEDKQSIGVIAQEVEDVLPQLVHTDEEGMKSVAYGNITAVLIEALKEQQAQIEELKARLDGLTK